MATLHTTRRAAVLAHVKRQEKRIEQLYCKHCSGVEIDIMDIGRIFDTGRNALAQNPALTDDELSKVIVDFVQTVRKN